MNQSPPVRIPGTTLPKLSQFLPLSPNEVAEREAMQGSQARIARLLQVRKQSRILAEERRRAQGRSSGQEWAGVLTRLNEQWETQRQQKLEALRSKANQAKAVMGFAQRQAAIVEGQVDERKAKAIAEATRRRKEEKENSCLASHAFMNERDYVNLPITQRAAWKAQSKTQEKSRTATLVHKYRAKMEKSYPVVEIPSAPIQKSNRTALRKLGIQKFDETYYNRDFAAIRCDIPGAVVALGSLKARRPDVRKEATEIRQQTDSNLHRKQEKNEKAQETAQIRYSAVMYDILMHKKHDELAKCFENLYVDDRKRIQHNAGLLAGTKRDAFFPTAELEKQFENQFYLKTPTEKLPLDRYGTVGRNDIRIAMKKDLSTDSIEFRAFTEK